MTATINGVEYSFLTASDVIRDGLGFECWRNIAGKQTLVLEVFRSDAEKCFKVSQYLNDLPLELCEHVISQAKLRLGDFVP
jgi:hypothetical protein